MATLMAASAGLGKSPGRPKLVGMDAPPIPQDPAFRAVITPQRSLSRRGLMLLAAVLVALSAAISVLFLSMGAWPVVGFAGAELLLALLLLRLHVRAGRASEMLMLDQAGLTILRTAAGGQRHRLVLPVGWLRVELTDHPGRVPSLHLVQRDRRIEVARDLNEPDKRDLAAALAAALQRQRSPRFDNPQLRDEPDVSAP